MKQSVFIGPVEIAGFSNSLSSGFRELGWNVYSLDLDCHPFNYGVSTDSCVMRALQRMLRWSHRVSTNSFLIRSVKIVARLVCFFWVAMCCKNIIFISGYSFLPKNRDLWFLKLLKKKIIHVYLGSDSRPVYFTGKTLDSGDIKNVNLDSAAELTLLQQAKLEKIQKYSDLVVDNPLSGIIQKGSLVNWFSLGFPTVIENNQRSTNKKITVLHAPSHRGFKGTDLILKSFDELKEEGHDFKVVLLEGRSNAEVKEELLKADIVVDEMYSDCPLAGLGAEGAAAGCAVIVGGYGWEHLRRITNQEMYPESIQITVDELKTKLIELFQNRGKCTEIGEELRKFISENWSAKKVAAKYADLFKGEFPTSWIYSPCNMNYAFGAGAQKKVILKLMQKYVDMHGVSALGLTPDSIIENTIRQEIS